MATGWVHPLGGLGQLPGVADLDNLVLCGCLLHPSKVGGGLCCGAVDTYTIWTVVARNGGVVGCFKAVLRSVFRIFVARLSFASLV